MRKEKSRAFTACHQQFFTKKEQTDKPFLAVCPFTVLFCGFFAIYFSRSRIARRKISSVANANLVITFSLVG